MPGKARVASGGWIYHVLNRSVGRMRMLKTPKDFLAFEQVMHEAHERIPLLILSYGLLGNHWHFLAWPEKEGELTGFFRWLAHTPVMRWQVSHHTVGYGHLYQGRYRSFPVEPGESLLEVWRYVERNALSAGLTPACRSVALGQLMGSRAGHAAAAGPQEDGAGAHGARRGWKSVCQTRSQGIEHGKATGGALSNPPTSA